MNDEQTMKLQEKFGTSFAELERNIMNEVKQIREQFAEIVNTVEYNSKDIADLKKEMKKMKEEMNTTEKEYKEELDRVETYAARENLVFLNIPEKIQKEGERENVEKVMKEFLITKLQFTEQEVDKIEYQRIPRVRSGPASLPKPIKARYLRYKDKVEIQQKAKLLKGTKIFITDDLSKRVRSIRRSQISALKTARNAGKLAYFSRTEPTKLFIDHVWMPVKDQPRFVDEFEKSEVTQRTRDQSTPKKTTGEMHKKGMPVAGGPKSLAMETDTQGASVGEK